MSSRAAAILLAGGRGTRLGSNLPKGFVDLAGMPLLVHCVRAVEAAAAIEMFLVVAPGGFEERATSLAGVSAKFGGVVPGGTDRQASVRAGTQVLPPWVETAVPHDVARPLAPPELFDEVVRALDADETAVGVAPVLPVADTLKRVEDAAIRGTIDRAGLHAVQTPQSFRALALAERHRMASRLAVRATDDAGLFDGTGVRVITVAGDPANLKITTRADLELAAALLSMSRR